MSTGENIGQGRRIAHLPRASFLFVVVAGVQGCFPENPKKLFIPTQNSPATLHPPPLASNPNSPPADNPVKFLTRFSPSTPNPPTSSQKIFPLAVPRFRY